MPEPTTIPVPQPFAVYSAPDKSQSLVLTPQSLDELRNVETMYPGEIDRDVATEPPLDSNLGDLRRQVISIQRNINVF